ncbi:hypothetical protein ARMGADRAFT_945602, partial [Armillaria gallica]
SEWLHLLEFAYNCHESTLTSSLPFKLLLGFVPTSPLERVARIKTPHLTAEATTFLNDLEVHRQDVRNSIAQTQEA